MKNKDLFILLNQHYVYWWPDSTRRLGTSSHGPLTRYAKLRVVPAPVMPGTISPPPTLRKPLVSDPGMHHGTCATHVPWCMPGSLTRGGGENVPVIPCACATRNFTYLARGPWYWPSSPRLEYFGPHFINGFQRNSNSMEISFHSHFDSNTVIATKFCTRNGSCAVVACAKFVAIWWPATELQEGEISFEFELMEKNWSQNQDNYCHCMNVIFCSVICSHKIIIFIFILL